LATRYPSAALNEHEVAAACRRAAWKLRSSPRSGAASERTPLDSAVVGLLEAIARALAQDKRSVSDDIQRAAIHLAQQLHVSGEQHPRGMHAGHASRYPVRSDMGWGAVRGEVVPFSTSLRLGRMG
jgi:hypothetical protein